MATDATGTPTALGIPKYNTSADAPSGLGFNAAMDTIDTLITQRLKVTGSPADADVPVWDNAAGQWKPSSVKSPTIAGQAVVASSIGGLGTATNGKMGLLRVGTTPYDFIPVTYDSTYAKWVSPAQIIGQSGTGARNTVQWSATANGDFFGGVVVPFKQQLTAGLTLQVRMHGLIRSANTGVTSEWHILVQHFNVGDNGGVTMTDNLSSINVVGLTNSTWYGRDGGWAAVGTVTPKDFAIIYAVNNNGGGGTVTQDFWGNVSIRWVG